VEGETNQAIESVRVDLWAWSVRLFKTRAQAGAACRKAQILVNGQRCRAARAVRIGDEIRVRQGLLVRVLEVTALLRRRVGAGEVNAYLLDRTPPEEIERVAALERERRAGSPCREEGSGRPTKRERRELDGIGAQSLPEPPEPESPSFAEFVEAFLKRPRR